MALLLVGVVGCGAGSKGAAANAPFEDPFIEVQPANASVPMGLSATFSVQAYAANPQYQWSRDGSPISGATSNTYFTDSTAFTDSGSTFTVKVSDDLGSVVSEPATLTVTARATLVS